VEKIYEWIPYKRFVLLLDIEAGGKPQRVFLGRFMMGKSARKECDRLAVYAGYRPKVVDTRENNIREN